MIANHTAYLQYLKMFPLVVLPDVGGECCVVCFGGGETVTLGISHVVAVGRQECEPFNDVVCTESSLACPLHGHM